MKNQTNGKRVLVATGIVLAAVMLVGCGIALFTKVLVGIGMKQIEKANENLVREQIELTSFPQTKTIQDLVIQLPDEWTTDLYDGTVMVQNPEGTVVGFFDPMDINLAQFFKKRERLKERLEERGLTILRENNFQINATRFYEYICSHQDQYIVLSFQGYREEKVLLSTWQFSSRDAYLEYHDLTKQISLQVL